MGKHAPMADGLKFLEPDSAPLEKLSTHLTSSVQAPYTVWCNSAYSAGQDLKL
jgi:hypothetical protein